MSSLNNNNVENTKNIYDLSKYIDFSKLNDESYLDLMNLKKMKKNDDYFILKYKKEELNAENYKSLGLFRSVIIKDGKVVSFAPQKSIPIDLFEYEKEDIHLEEFIEGTMIQMYYSDNDWNVATRSSIGAKTYFYNKNKSFRNMFLECMNNCELEFDMFDKDKVYSFVIQHPDNRIVGLVYEPQLYLCGVYKIYDSCKIECLSLDNDEIFTKNKKLRKPKIYDFTSIEDTKNMFANKDKTPYTIVGVILKTNNNMFRSKIRNPNYENVKKLKGNQAKKQFQYYSLRKSRQIQDYLKYYPEDKGLFKVFREQIHDFTNELFKNYIDCFVNKKGTLKDYPFQYKVHMYKLHEAYLSFDKNSDIKRNINRDYVIQYVNDLEPAKLMYFINYKYKHLKKE